MDVCLLSTVYFHRYYFFPTVTVSYFPPLLRTGLVPSMHLCPSTLSLVLVILGTTLFTNFYYSVNPRCLRFIDDIENFESYHWEIEVYEELLREICARET